MIPAGGLLPAKLSQGLATYPETIGGLKAYEATVRVSGETATVGYKVKLPPPFKGYAPVEVTTGVRRRAPRRRASRCRCPTSRSARCWSRTPR